MKDEKRSDIQAMWAEIASFRDLMTYHIKSEATFLEEFELSNQKYEDEREKGWDKFESLLQESLEKEFERLHDRAMVKLTVWLCSGFFGFASILLAVVAILHNS